MTTCIGWDDLDGHTCPHWHMPTHGCLLPEGHPGTSHRCKCGATHRERSRRAKGDAA